ncbi:fimbria/pilus outer membrane usher protein [Deefgea rivuli]|uniref:fimbria/pilus outer membrane usher protein n=1 Tax=Deefgea rivuli TaxID=400948 RepID=UPI0004843F6D|nr:fimbria/pilus outer membrane usher protein [Deefgea rivuli]
MQKLKLLLLASLYCTPVLAAEQLIIRLTVNGVEQGDVPAIYDQGGYWLAAETIKGSGINTLDGEQQTIAGRVFFRADKLIGIESKMNEADLSLSLNAAASEFGERQVSLNRNRGASFPAPAPFSGYLNYQLAAFSQGSDLEYQFNPTLNLNEGAWNFRSAHSFNTQNSQHRWTRLNTTLDYDQPENMLRASAGDISPSAAALGFSQTMGGVSVSRVFNMQPNFNSSPSFSTQASVTQPSTAEIYLNGQRVSTQNLQPGIYNFNDLSFFSGLQNVEIVIRDAAGNAQRISVPYYFDDSLLKAGLSDFNYSAGLARQSGSFDSYQDFAYSAYQRVGVTDWFTLGAQTSGNTDSNSSGILANFGLATYGTLATAFAWAKHDQQNRGAAQLMQYRYINQALSISANARRQDKDFLKHDENSVLTAPDWSANIGMGWGNQQIGNLSIDIGRQVGPSDALTFNRYMLAYTKSPMRQMSVSMQAQLQDRASGHTWYGFLNFSWFFDQGRNLYSSARYENNQTLTSANFSQSAPTGEGWGYNFGFQQQDNGTDYTAWAQNKRQHGQVDLSMMRSNNSIASNTNWQAAWSGALAYTEGHYALTRPITQSFAVVELPEIPNVGVLHNGSQVGTTDEHGIVFLPDLASYGYHQIGLEQNDIPIQYSLERLQTETLSGNNDGRVVQFQARQVAAISGQLLRADGRALVNQWIKVETDSEPVLLQTALDGRFYTEALTAGRYRFSSDLCSGELIIPQTSDVITELAPITCSEKAF